MPNGAREGPVRWLADEWLSTQRFLDGGGWVLVAILAVTFVMWTLIFERWRYLGRPLAADVERVLAEWRGRPERRSWHAHQIRRELISRVALELRRSVPTIKVLVAICPLLGILGTVTGMIEVFDVLAFAGSGNPRAMAQGVSRATIPTMAGMVAALSGLVVVVQLESRAAREAERVADALGPET
jgi:biopolymer transport protein ExbB